MNASKTARWKESQAKASEHREWLRTFPVQPYRERHYSPKVRGMKVRWWFAPIRGEIDGGFHPDNYRRNSAKNGKFICVARAFPIATARGQNFDAKVSGGWTFRDRHFTTLLSKK